MAIYGSYPCPDCGASVTAWRGDPATGRVFDADPYDPYRPHVCAAGAAHLRRIAELLAAAVAQMDGGPDERRNRHERAPATPVTPATRPDRAGSRSTPARPSAPPPDAARTVAVGATGTPSSSQPVRGQTVDV